MVQTGILPISETAGKMVIAIATLRLPTLYKKQREESFIHLPDPVFYAVTMVAIIAQFYMVYLSAKSMSPFMILCCVGSVVFFMKNG